MGRGSPSQSEQNERERRTLIALSILAGGRTLYAEARASYERRVRSVQPPEAFAELVQHLIAEKLIDFEADQTGREPPPGIIALRLRPRGMAMLK